MGPLSFSMRSCMQRDPNRSAFGVHLHFSYIFVTAPLFQHAKLYAVRPEPIGLQVPLAFFVHIRDHPLAFLVPSLAFLVHSLAFLVPSLVSLLVLPRCDVSSLLD